MVAESRPKVLILDDNNESGYLEALGAVANHAGFEPQIFSCVETAYEHLTGDGDTAALIASLGITRAACFRRPGKVSSLIARQMIDKAPELGTAVAVIEHNRVGSAQYGLNMRDVIVPLEPRGMLAGAISNWLHSIAEPSYIEAGLEEAMPKPEATTLQRTLAA